MLNSVQIIGRLGAAPEMRYSANGTAITNLRVATDDGYGEKKHTEWFGVVTFNKLAELCAQHLDKGRLVYISGRLQTQSWEKDGAKHYRTEVVANQVIFLDKAGNGATVPDGIEDPDDLPFEM